VAEEKGLGLFAEDEVGKNPPTKGQRHKNPNKEGRGAAGATETGFFPVRTVFVFLHTLCLAAG
jgi:hypothetical protein